MFAPILIVDDDAEFREVVSLVLTRAGYSVVCAESGSRALEMLETVRPTLVFVDVQMPGMSGPDFVREAQERGYDPSRVIMCSALAPGCLSPAKWCITKPLDVDLILRVVEDFCGRGTAFAPIWSKGA